MDYTLGDHLMFETSLAERENIKSCQNSCF
jgi:hypothetical protein